MKTFTIGRSPKSDVPIDHKSVSRRHAELVATDEGNYYLTDCKSVNGTFRLRKGEWERIRQDFVAPDEPLMLGGYRTTARELASRLSPRRRTAVIPAAELARIEARELARGRVTGDVPVVVERSPKDDLPSGSVERDPETGAVIKRSGQ